MPETIEKKKVSPLVASLVVLAQTGGFVILGWFFLSIFLLGFGIFN